MSFSGLIDASFLQTRVAYAVQTDPAALLSMYVGAIPKGNLAAPETVPNYLFGCYNMALTLFLLVPSVTQSFGVSALPSVTRAFQTRDSQKLKRTVEAVLRITFLTATADGGGAFRFGAARRTTDLRCTAGHGHRGARADDLGRGVRFCGAVPGR